MTASRPPARVAGDIVVATVMRTRGITGMQAHTAALAVGLHECNVRCEVVTPFSAGRRWLPIFAVRPLFLYRLNRSWSTRWYRHWHRIALRDALERTLRDKSCPTVLAQDPLSADAALDLRRRGLARRVVLICHFNVSQADEFRVKGELDDETAFQAIRRFEARVLAEVDAVVYVSEWARRIVEQDRGISPRFSTVVHNGITDVAGSNASLTRAALSLPEDDIVLITVGTIEPRKNQIALVDVFAAVAAQNASARLLFVGDGPQRAELEQRILERGLVGRVQCLGARDDVPALLALSDVYVHYARLENWPIALLEAARAGLPIAAAPVGGVGEMLRELGGVPLSGDPAAASAALLGLIYGAATRRRLGDEARARYRRHFTSRAMGNGILEVLARIEPAPPSG